MRRFYSRLATVEERKNFKKAVLFIGLTVAALVLLFFVGIPALGKFAAFVSDLRKSSAPISKQDVTPPAPPTFSSLPQFTNQQTISVTGSSEPGATVKLFFNGSETDSLADKNGTFSFSGLELNSGANTYYAIAQDSSGNQSQKTKEFTITFSNKPPSLSVDSPADGTQFFGTTQRQVTIQGATDSGSSITINGRIITVDDGGKFQYTTTLNDGANPFKVIATDQAGNTTEKDITLNFAS